MSIRWRLFVAAWPDTLTVAALAGLDRPVRPGVRWTRPDQWHITLRFLGDCEPAVVTEALDALLVGPGPGPGSGGWPAEAPRARLGPATARLGRLVLQVPVEGLDDLARAVIGATAQVGEPPGPGPLRGHLTVARARHPRDLTGLVGQAISSSWPVREVTLVSSSHGRPPGRSAAYEVIARWPLA